MWLLETLNACKVKPKERLIKDKLKPAFRILLGGGKKSIKPIPNLALLTRDISTHHQALTQWTSLSMPWGMASSGPS